MITQQKAKELAALLQLPEEQQATFITALTSTEEAEIELPTVNILSDEDLTKLKNNEYKNGKDKGVEMAVKEAREKLGLEFQGKTIEGLLEAHGKKVLNDAKIEPAQQVQQLTEDLKKVRSEYDSLKDQLTQKEQQAQRAATYSEIYRQIPSLGEGALPVDKVVKLMEADGFSFKSENGQIVPYKGEEPVKDKLANILAIKDVIQGYAKENNILPKQPDTPRGRGAGDGKATPTFTKQSELKAHYESQGKNINGQEYMNHIRQIRSANPEFDMNN
jgi:hypothetical protein